MSERSIAFPSTGDSLKDEELASQYEIHDNRMGQNFCPNGCGQMTIIEMTIIDLNNRKCPVCKFHCWQNTPIKMSGEKVQ